MRQFKNVGLIFFLTGTLLSGIEASAISFVEFQGHYYGLSDTQHAEWTSAEAEAISLGGHLVAINSPEEQSFINNTFLPDGSNAVYWIGLNDVASEGTYVWSTGFPVTYWNFAPGEPDDFGAGEDFSIINWQYGRGHGALGEWSDCDLDGQSGFGGVDSPYFGLFEFENAPSAFGDSPSSRSMDLNQNFPNPFNPQTTIAYDLFERGSVTLQVFDTAGRLVRSLITAELHTPGRYEVVWNGRDEGGRQVASGTYFYRLEAGSFSETKRMVLVK